MICLDYGHRAYLFLLVQCRKIDFLIAMDLSQNTMSYTDYAVKAVVPTTIFCGGSTCSVPLHLNMGSSSILNVGLESGEATFTFWDFFLQGQVQLVI